MWSHFDFAIMFAGLGYIGLWAFAAADVARNLSPGLQLAGLAAAAFAVVRVAMMLRARRTKPAAAAAPPAGPSLAAIIRRSRLIGGPPKRRKPVEPRSEFGLRKPGPWPRR